MQGDSIKALRQVSIAKGWDPQKIQGTNEDISNFNKYPDPLSTGDRLGKLPGGLGDATGGFPEDHPPINANAQVPWNAPNRTAGSDANRRTNNSDPNGGGV